MIGRAFERRRAQSERYNFVAFSRDRAYREANRELILRAFSRLPSPFFQVDVASGTGLVAQEVSDLCQQTGKTATIIGVDLDPFAVESARESVPSTSYCAVGFIQGRAQDVHRLLHGRIPPGGVDYVSIHDAIHEIEGEKDKRSVFSSIASILKPGGIFTYNSAFTTVAMEGSAIKWGRMKARAFSMLGAKRDRTVEAIRIHSPEEYKQMIVNAGLVVIYETKRVVRLARSALEAIARYPAFVEGAFADMVGAERVSFEKKSQALIDALDSLGIAEIPRIWHETMAQKMARGALASS
ncbi:MAG TPA: class I SAM-dependent methyltransferase [Anaerolineae bacterium]|nr:class I SAM-dependent methyltransferase [Anaerolineae bacterium]